MLAHWATQLCDALDYLHSQAPPVTLGCLSPASIHVSETGHAQVIEVGLVRYQRSGLLGPARGVPGYAAPEQRTGQVTPRSDLYALGIILFELVTRIDPRQRPLPPLRRYSAGWSDQIIESIARAYRRDPNRRFASAAEMREAFLSAPVPATTSSSIVLPPFQLSAGTSCTTIPELVQLCATHWEEGLLALINGRIVEWLTRAAQNLHEGGQGAGLEEIDLALTRTTRAFERVVAEAARPGVTGAATEMAQNVAYSAWLQDMGAKSIQPSLEVHPSRFDFGVVGATIRATSAVRIRNKGHGFLAGRVESSLKWLTIPNPSFGCRAGETTEVRIVARGRTLPSGETRSAQAVHVVSNGGDTWLEARATSSPPMLGVDPTTLNYGPIVRGASRVANLRVANTGGGYLTGQVIPRAPWLRIRHPEFGCPAGASAQVAIELLSDHLPEGSIRIRRALVVDSDSGQAQIDVAWRWARPALELDTTGVDLGSVHRGEQIARTLTLSNSGTADLTGYAKSLVDWLAVQPTEFRCKPGASLTLSVTCDTGLVPGGSTVEAEAIAIHANAGEQTLSASIEVLAPQLIVEPQEIDLGTVRDGDQVEETFMVGNRGSLPWHGLIQANVPWLILEPTELRCDPGHFMPVTVMLDPGALEAGGAWTVPDAIQVGIGPEAQIVAVRAALSRPQLEVERHSLDFGLIGRTDIASLPLEIINSGTGELQWRISVQGAWIEVVPESGTCGPGEKATVQVNAYALAVDGDSEQAWLTVRSNGGRADLPAGVALSSPSLAVEPLSLDLTSVNYAPASDSVRIFNGGVGTLRGTTNALVPWLSCEPTEFECPTGVSTQIQVSAILEDLHEGTYQAPDALGIESNAGSQTVDVALTLSLTPVLRLSTEALVFAETSEQVLRLENQGYGTLRVQIVPDQDWIEVDRREWTIKAQRKARVRVRLVDPPEAVEGNIEIRTPDRVLSLPIRAPDQAPA
jgi:hypothetical protein